MHESSLPPDTTEPVNPEVRFEKKDTNVRDIVIAAVAIVVLSAAVHLLISGVFANLIARPPASGSPQAVMNANRLIFPKDFGNVPAPRLQIDETRDLEKLRQDERAFLNNEGRAAAWVDKGKVVSVPIAEAMRLLSDPQTAQALGVPVRPAAKVVEGKR